mmetsp:Transcript_50794/g.107790  ORF Transcript_50794/g.107790 Transcript_50794/m.107790 type:complete len:393 (+) Transcript_50794:199-1377(+)
MCSKEAWDHFLFVPPSAAAPRRGCKGAAKRRSDFGCFLQAPTKVALTIRKAPPSQSNQVTTVARRRRATDDEDDKRSMKDAAMLGVGAVAGAASAFAASAAAPAGAAALLLKTSMMAAPPPPMPMTRAEIEAQYLRENWSLLDMLLPNFNTDTFIWRMSMIQLVNYGAALLLGNVMGEPKLCSLYLLGASWGPAIAGGALWRLILPMLLHANALHISFNLFFQLRIGFTMEKQFGRRKFCLLYLFCGFLGNLLSVVSNPYKLAVGASTSGFGLLGVWFAEVLLTWDLLGPSRSRLAMWFGFMISSCIMMSTLSPSVDFMGHFGGAFAGFLLAIILADMDEEHRPSWYKNAKTMAKGTTAFLIIGGLLKAITFGPDGPVPYCGTIFNPRIFPF